jgi:hypothetical protein
MKQHFTELEEAKFFVENLYKEEKWVIKTSRGSNGGYNVEWQEHKKYIAFDGKEYLDEVWTTEQGEMILVQDLSESHVRNVVRMMLRNERLQQQELLEKLQDLMEVGMDEIDEESTEPTVDFAPDDTKDAFILPEDAFSIKGNTTLN